MKKELTAEAKAKLKASARALGVDMTKLVSYKTGKANIMSRIYHAYASGSFNSLNRRLPGGVRVKDVIERYYVLPPMM